MANNDDKEMNFAGAFWFGLVVGWILSITFHSQGTHGLKDISSVIAAVGGASVTKLFPNAGQKFAGYCIGLAFGFFIHIVVSLCFWQGRVWPSPASI